MRDDADCQYSLAPEAYTSPAFDRLDKALFARHWIGIGRADLVPDAGRFRTLDIAGQSVLLLRDREGTLRAFANTCRHRAARLMEGEGACRGIRCPFHSWAYRLDGSLVAAPQMDGVSGFDKAENGLIPYRVEERAGFAFLCLSEDAPPLDTLLGDFEAVHAPWPLADLVTTRRREIEVACNWKAFLDVFNDHYHLPFVHPNSINSIYGHPDAQTETQGAYASQFGATEGTGGLLETQQAHALPPMPGLAGREAHGARYTWVFPNMTFAANSDALWVYEAYPLAPDRCHVVQSACFHPDTLASPGAEASVAVYHDRLDAALDEDLEALQNQQRGLACPSAQPGVLHPLLEANVACFARWYDDTTLSLTALKEPQG